MLRVGLTGGVATGKSFVGKALADLGCYLLEADKVGHGLLEPGGEAEGPVKAEFGVGIVDAEGRIDRRRLARIVFSDAAALKKLNAIIHPLVFVKERVWMDEIGARDPEGIAVVEAAILIETGSYRMFDRLIVTWCEPEVSIARAIERSGWTREEVLRRMEQQLPVEEKKGYADFVIDTGGTMESTLEQTRAVYAALRSLKQ